MKKSHIAFFISLALYVTTYLAFLHTKLVFTPQGLVTIFLLAYIPFLFFARCVDEVDDEDN